MAHSRRRFIRDPRTLQHRKGCGTRTGVGNLTRQLMVWYHPPAPQCQCARHERIGHPPVREMQAVSSGFSILDYVWRRAWLKDCTT
jgi:hypothetical protein